MTTMTLAVTPFRNDHEVRIFMELAYSDKVEDKREAIKKMNQLESRMSQLPMRLSSMKHILNVEIIQAEQREQNRDDDTGALQYACAVAVLKFVDVVSVPYRAHHARLSYRSIAKEVDLPGHIITLRHDIAHHHELPSLSSLLAAVEFSKQWLRKNCLDELIETMALFSEGSYTELLDIVAQETVQAFVEARFNFLTKRSQKRLEIADERVEEIRKALQMCNGGKEIMAEVLIQCGNFIMTPKQLRRIGYDSEASTNDLLPTCVSQFWKPIVQLCLDEASLISLLINKILTFITERYQFTPTGPSVIDRQRIGWIFYLIDQQQPSKLDLQSIFIRLARILQPWFAEQLSRLVTQMTDNNETTLQPVISEQKRDLLLRTISMFANPFQNTVDEQPPLTTTTAAAVTSLEILPRNELRKKELAAFKKRFQLGDIPAGMLNDEDMQNLEMNIDLSKTDRTFIGCATKRKATDPVPMKRKRTKSPSIDSSLFHDLLWRQHHYR